VNHPEESIKHSDHGGSLKSRMFRAISCKLEILVLNKNLSETEICSGQLI
jgi:hypothetical protein